MKRLFLALAFAGLLSPAFAAGTIPLSMSQQFDTLGKPLSGCKLYIIQAGTTSTPQNAYQDSGLTIAHPNPLTCDSAGRLPQFFLADGSIKVRLSDRNGVNQTFPGGGPSGLDNILVIGPSGGGGGGGTIDPTTILATGDMKATYGTGVLSGWVRANGRTIGSATSGATERANADCQALFLYLWSTDTALTVSTGRGASAAADWAANKQLTLPDARGSALAGLDDMGNTTKGTFAAVAAFNRGNATTIGSSLGAATRTLLATNLPASLSLTGSITGNVTMASILQLSGGAVNASNTSLNIQVYPTSSQAVVTNPPLTGTLSGAQTNAGGGQAFDSVSPYLLLTLHIKL
jgi:microcystin-dependent protein